MISVAAFTYFTALSHIPSTRSLRDTLLVSIPRKFRICERHVTLLLASRSCTCVHCVPVPVVSSDFGFRQCLRLMKTRAIHHLNIVAMWILKWYISKITKCFSSPFSLDCIEYKVRTSSHLHVIENERTKMYLPGTSTLASTYTYLHARIGTKRAHSSNLSTHLPFSCLSKLPWLP